MGQNFPKNGKRKKSNKQTNKKKPINLKIHEVQQI